MEDVDKHTCPLCGRDNHCGEKAVINGKTRPHCWCHYETFPKELPDLVPEELRNKACVCKDCLDKFLKEHGKKGHDSASRINPLM